MSSPRHALDPAARRTLLLIVLGITCGYHLGVGVLGWMAPEATLRFGAWFYGLHFDANAAVVVYMLKALGMYALFTGGLLALAISDPYKYRHLVYAIAGLLLLRAVTRVLFYDVLHEAFALAWTQNLVNVTILVAQALVLWVTVPREAPARKRAPRPAPSQALGSLEAALASASGRFAFASASGIR